jgi:hypothetical protein
MHSVVIIGDRMHKNFENFMKMLLLFVLSLSLIACGGDQSSFSGTWAGLFTSLDNNCPFPLADNVNSLFPMVVAIDSDDTFVVNGADGSTAVGGQGEGENISFTAEAAVFGDYGSVLPYVCTSTASVGFLTNGDSEAKITVTYSFSDCVTPDSSETIDCFARYYGEGTKL